MEWDMNAHRRRMDGIRSSNGIKSPATERFSTLFATSPSLLFVINSVNTSYHSVRGAMSGPISFTVRPPSAPFRPSPLGQSSRGPPSRRLFEANHDEEDDGGSSRRRERRPRDERVEGFKNGRTHGYVLSHAERPQGLKTVIVRRSPMVRW